MGVGGISIWQLLIVLVIILLLFGTKRLKNVGSDLGDAIKGFKRSMSGSEEEASTSSNDREGTANRPADQAGANSQSSRD